MNPVADASVSGGDQTSLSNLVVKAALLGCVLALAVGLGLGWLRYWTGFFTLAQGAAGGLLIAWLTARLAGTNRPDAPEPGRSVCLKLALLWLVVFQIGLAVGFGLAQPWFEPVDFVSTVLAGRGIEFVFGIASSGGAQKSFAMGASGFMWVVFSLVDGAVMFMFLAMVPWLSGRSADDGAADSPAQPKPKPWMKLVGWIVAGVMILAMLVDFYTINPAKDLKIAQAAIKFGDYGQALRLARRTAYFSDDKTEEHRLAETIAAQAVWKSDRPEPALNRLNRLLAQAPNYGPALLLRGEILIGLGRAAPAAADLAGYITSAQAPHKAPTAELARTYGQPPLKKRKPGSIRPARPLNRADRNLARAHALLGQAQLALNKPDEARLNLEAGLALDNTVPDYHYQLSLALDKKGQYETAYRECQTALRLAKRSEEGRFTTDLYYKRDWFEHLIAMKEKAGIK